MEKQTHTPGPWRVGDAGATVFGPPNGKPSPATIARVSFAMIPSEEMLANSRLIAAAPDLLAFARAYLAMVDEVASKGSTARPTFKQLNALIDMANAAIARATAEQSA